MQLNVVQRLSMPFELRRVPVFKNS